MAMVLIIVGSVFLTGMLAFFISQNVEHGEARFGPEGRPAPYKPEDTDRAPLKVTIKQDSKTDD